MLCQCLFVIIRISGVVEKYRGVLLPGILKLFYIDKSCNHDFEHVTITKRPVRSYKKLSVSM